ncbi:MAG: protein kinase [Planctomycetes bacterium]|nr:protein kinase [Planctomycetota bacterium]
MDDRKPDPLERLAGEVADGAAPGDVVQRARAECDPEEQRALRVLAFLRWRGGAGAAAEALDDDLLGAGASGRVHSAIDPVLERKIAVKTLAQGAFASSAQRERFLSEARKLARVEHPNVVRIHAVEELDGALRIQLELVEGRTLEEWIRDDGPLDPVEAARVGIELCRALAAIHAAGLVHCDLKPENVLRERGGRIVVLDLGVARVANSTEEARVHPSGGTPLFMAPEQFRGTGPIGPPADLFALGVVLYWLVSAARPFEGASYAELRERVLRGAHVPLLDRRPDVPVGLAAVVEHALAVEPGDRFASAGEMERALRAWLVPAVPPVRSRATRRWIVGVALAAGLGIVATFFARGRPPENDAWSCRLLTRRGGQVIELGTGARVNVGDALRLEFQCDVTSHVYVFDEDARGAFFALFPLAGFVPQNPLAAGTTHVLPGARGGSDAAWVVTSAGGDETLLVVRASEPIEELEELRRRTPAPSDLSVEAAGGPLLPRDRESVLRGIGGTEFLQGDWKVPEASIPGRLAEIAEELARRPDARAQVRVIRWRCDS